MNPMIDRLGTIFYINKNMLFHRENGPAIEEANGDKRWYINGRYHRIDGPAVESHGLKKWFINGIMHRMDGPAIEYDNGAKLWFYHGELIECSSQEEFERLMKLRIFW